MVEVGEKNNDGVILFVSRSGSNKLSAAVLAVDVNRSGIRGEKDEIQQNKIEKNHVVG